MKIIFLDIDGVLNSKKCFEEKHFNGSVQICPELVLNLNRIIRDTGAEIVLSSAWIHEGLLKVRKKLKNAGVKGKIIGGIPNSAFIRGVEIYRWMCSQGMCECNEKNISYYYVIIDDDNDFLDSQKPYFIKTDSSIGLSEKDADRAIEILGRK